MEHVSTMTKRDCDGLVTGWYKGKRNVSRCTNEFVSTKRLTFSSALMEETVCSVTCNSIPLSLRYPSFWCQLELKASVIYQLINSIHDQYSSITTSCHIALTHKKAVLGKGIERTPLC